MAFEPVDTDCTHTWQPIPNYCGRYRCTSCNCMGYRGLVTVNMEDGVKGDTQVAWQSKTKKKASCIFAYICKHPDCRKTALRNGKFQFCIIHTK